MKNTLTLGVLALLTLAACNKDQDNFNDPQQAPAFSLTDPQAGQVARFERIQLAAGDSLPILFRDTLLLEVTSITNDYIQVEERLSDGSQSQSGTSAVSFPGHAFSYRLSAKPAALSIKAIASNRLESRLFPSLTEQSHSLAYQSSSMQTTNLEGLRVQAPYLPLNRSYQIVTSEKEVIATLNHEGRQDGLPGFTFVHDREFGLHFMLVETDLQGNASGWKLIK